MKTKALDRQPTSPLLIWAVWLGVILLAMIGVASAIGRAVFMDDFAGRMEPQRQALMESLQRNDPHAAERAADVAWLDGRFAAHPVETVLHILPGGIFLLLAPLQFSTRLRRRHIRIHRWSGRIVIVTAIIGAVAGLYFGILMPYAGWSEAVPIVIFGGLFLIAVGRGYLAIRRHQVARHREWMIRVLALALAISVVRILMGVLDYALTPAGFTPRQNFVLAVWASWIISLAAAELWIRHTRTRVLIASLVGLAITLGPAALVAQQVPVKQTRQVFRLGGADAAEPYAFAESPRLVVDSAGNIYALVASDGAVSVFDPSGGFVRTIGRKGQGPGEFQVAAAHGLLGDTLWISNWPTPQISRFLRNGTHVATTRTPFEYGRSFGGPVGLTALLAGGRALVLPPSPVLGVQERILLPVVVGPADMMRRDTIAMMPTPRGLFIPSVGTWAFDPVPAGPLVARATNGLAVAVAQWSDTAPGVVDLRVLSANGTQRWRRSVRLTAPAISRGIRDSLIAAGVTKARPQITSARARGGGSGGSFESMVERGLALPRHFAPIRRLVLGIDGTLWVEQMDGLRGGNWLVLDRSGTPRFQVRLPASVRVDDATIDSIWGTDQDELGVAYMIRLRIDG